jgi:hypothetical protein
LGAKIGTNVKISRRISKYSLSFGKKVAKLPKKKKYKNNSPHFRLGFFDSFKKQVNFFWLCSKNLWSFNGKSLLGIWDGYN